MSKPIIIPIGKVKEAIDTLYQLNSNKEYKDLAGFSKDNREAIQTLIAFVNNRIYKDFHTYSK